MSLSAEIGPSAEHKPSSMDKTIETTISAGAKITPNVAFGKERGWTVKFEGTVEVPKNQGINLQWDIYKK